MGNPYSIEFATTLGAILSGLIYILCIAVFGARLAGRPRLEYWTGILLIILLIPLGFLLFTAPGHARPPIYYIQVGLMMAYLIVELWVDYIARTEFREVRWKVIAYVTLFFAGSGGMIGVASLAGTVGLYSSVVLFLAMASLAFYQRAITGQ